MRNHGDAIADTGDGYTLERQPGELRIYEIKCLWCDWYAIERDKTLALGRYVAHEKEMLATEAASSSKAGHTA